jgi:ubiquinone/menaquinone biosynthesis C-methylase UbiE
MEGSATALSGPVSSEEERLRAAYDRRRIKDQGRYSGFPAAHLFQVQEREREVLRLLRRHGFMPLADKKILEVGCGTGAWLRDFIKWGAEPRNLVGLDLRPAALTQARRLCPADVTLECSNAVELRFPDAEFDLVLQATVFTSVLEAEVRRRIAAAMLRVVRVGGLILWYDFFMNNPGNSDVRAVRKQEIRSLFPGCSVELRRVNLAPPLVRWVAPHTWLLCHVLARLSTLCTHYLGAIRKRETSYETRD